MSPQSYDTGAAASAEARRSADGQPPRAKGTGVIVRESTITSIVIQPEAIAPLAPSVWEDDAYVARLANGSLGNPGFVVLDYVAGRPVDRIIIGTSDSVCARTSYYARTKTVGREVIYVAATEAGFIGWTAGA